MLDKANSEIHSLPHHFLQWNNKLTTPPGLYLFTMGVFKPFKELYAFGLESPDEICPLYLVRFTNLIFGTANFFLVYLIQSNLNAKYLVSTGESSFELLRLNLRI